MKNEVTEPTLTPEQHEARIIETLDAYHDDETSIDPNRFVDMLVQFVLTYPDEARVFLKAHKFPTAEEAWTDAPEHVKDELVTIFALDCKRQINGAIGAVLRTATDLVRANPEAKSDIRGRVFTRLKKILPLLTKKDKSGASIPTRIAAIARFRAMEWKTERLRERDKCVPTLQIDSQIILDSDSLAALGKRLVERDTARVKEQTAIAENPARITRLFCTLCRELQDVVSQTGALCAMECGHDRAT